MVLGGHAHHGPKKAAWFYMREASYVEEELPPQEAALARSEGNEHQLRLQALKADIHASGMPCRAYPRPAALASLVESDLTAHLDAAFPPTATLSELARERLAHVRAARAVCDETFVPDDALCLALSQASDRLSLAIQSIARHSVHHASPTTPCPTHTAAPSAPEAACTLHHFPPSRRFLPSPCHAPPAVRLGGGGSAPPAARPRRDRLRQVG